MSHFVYILYSRQKDRYYIGSTCDNLQERLRRHNTHHKGYTGSSKWELVYSEQFESKSEAFAREKQIKGLKSRRMIQRLILGSRS